MSIMGKLRFKLYGFPKNTKCGLNPLDFERIPNGFCSFLLHFAVQTL